MAKVNDPNSGSVVRIGVGFVECSNCRGSGRSKTGKSRCGRCRGKKRVLAEVQETAGEKK